MHPGEREDFALPPLAWESLPGLFPEFDEPGRWLPLLQLHARLVSEAAPAVRVTAVQGDALVRRQYAESLELLRLALPHWDAQGAVDVGSGGGYPGLVMASVLPRAQFHLVEPLQKRARLLESLAGAMQLGNVRVVAMRAEDAGRTELRDTAGLVTARAVASLPELLEYTAPFARPGGILALPKGSGLAGELERAGTAMARLACSLEATCQMRAEISGTLNVLLLRKLGATADVYPRRAGVPGRRPL